MSSPKTSLRMDPSGALSRCAYPSPCSTPPARRTRGPSGSFKYPVGAKRQYSSTPIDAYRACFSSRSRSSVEGEATSRTNVGGRPASQIL